MQNTETKATKPFLKINDAANATGLSRSFLRRGCQDGTIPHIKSGTTYFINMGAMLAKLNVESEAQKQ